MVNYAYRNEGQIRPTGLLQQITFRSHCQEWK